MKNPEIVVNYFFVERQEVSLVFVEKMWRELPVYIIKL